MPISSTKDLVINSSPISFSFFPKRGQSHWGTQQFKTEITSETHGYFTYLSDKVGLSFHGAFVDVLKELSNKTRWISSIFTQVDKDKILEMNFNPHKVDISRMNKTAQSKVYRNVLIILTLVVLIFAFLLVKEKDRTEDKFCNPDLLITAGVLSVAAVGMHFRKVFHLKKTIEEWNENQTKRWKSH